MAKTFTPNKNKWGVKISVEQRATRSSIARRSPRREVVIENPRSNGNSNANTERWYEELVTFIGQSKREVEIQAEFLINTVKKWQHKTKKHFDVIQQKIIREHNLQSLSSSNIEASVQSSIEPVTTRANKQTVSKAGKNVCYPSMPVLLTQPEAEDNLVEFLSNPSENIPSKISKISKRRNTVGAAASASENRSLDFAVRKASRAAHTSVLAISNNRPDTSLETEVNTTPGSTTANNCNSKRINIKSDHSDYDESFSNFR